MGLGSITTMQFWKKSTAKTYSPEDRKNLKKAYSRILWFLSKRDYSVKELTTKLLPYFDEDTTEAAIEKANAAGWLKPPEVISQQVYKRLNNRGKGHFFILRELKKLGLPPVNEDNEKELEKAFTLVEKKFFKHSDETAEEVDIYEQESLTYKERQEQYKEKQKRRQKIFSFLASRGFSSDTIKKVMNEKF